jgi:hypothetical protein
MAQTETLRKTEKLVAPNEAEIELPQGQAAMPGHVAPLWGWVPVLAITGAVGLMLIAVADNAARKDADWAMWLFWIGLLTLFVPVALRISMLAISRMECISLIVILGMGLYATKVLQSPVSFVLHDEFSHWRTANDIIQTGRLFTENSLIPISAIYPGLEIVTAAVSNLTGLSIFVSGILVLGMARLVLLLSLYLFFERAGGSIPIAGLASLLYMANPNYVFFGSQFAYESLALPLAALTLFIVIRRTDTRKGRFGFNLAEVLAIAAVTVSHHITSYMVVALLVLWTGVHLVKSRRTEIEKQLRRLVQWYAGETTNEREPDNEGQGIGNKLGRLIGWYAGEQQDPRAEGKAARQAPGFSLRRDNKPPDPHVDDPNLKSPGSAALLAVLMALFWLVSVGPMVLSYVGPHLLGGIDELLRLMTGEARTRELFVSAGQLAPLWMRVNGVASVILILVALPFGLLYVWRRQRANTVVFTLSIAALAYPASLALRLTQRGAETSNRLSEFVFVALVLVLSLGVVRPLLSRGAGLGAGLVRRGIFTVLATVLFVGGITVGWPYWGILPGPYLVGADPRSIEPQSLAAADWVKDTLGPNQRVAADRTNGLLLGSFGQQFVATALSTRVSTYRIFFAPEIGEAEREIISQAGIQYVLVDSRLSTGLPQVGFYFERGEPDTMNHKVPMDPSLLDKFDRTPGVNRIFDSGNIVIYDVRALSSVP